MTTAITINRSGNRCRLIVCTDCGTWGPHEAKGRCRKCYDAEKWRRNKEARSQLKPCQHCGERLAHRPRGLCSVCYLLPGIRDIYRPLNKYGVLGTGHGPTPTELPEPTTFLPGTAEKIAVLAARVAAGLALHHPADARGCVR